MSGKVEAKYHPDELDSEEKVRTPSPEAETQSAQQQPKDPRSRCKYNILIRFFFFWVEPLFCYGCCNDLKQSDLYATPEEADSKRLTDQFNIYWNQELSRKASGKKPRLWMVLAKSFKWRFLLQAILAFIEVVMLIGQSLLLGELVDYFTEVNTDQVVMDCRNITLPEQSISTRDAYLAAMGLLLLALMVAMIHAHYALVATKIGMMARIMTTSAVYHKILKLSQTIISELTVGHVINVVSNDVQRFDLAFLFLPYLWIAPLHIIVFTYLVYLEVGWVVFVTLFFFIIQIPAQLVLAKIFTKFRFKSAEQTDQRVRVMNEVITGIRVIKMYAWEYAFKRVVTAIRKQEIRLIKIGGMIRTLTASFNFGVALNLFMAITFLTYVGTGNGLTPRKVIITLSLLTFLRNISASFLIRSVFLLFEAKVAFTRIQNILEQEELTPEEIQAIDSSVRGKKIDRTSKTEGYFRQSPWLPGMRKVIQEPVELTAVTSPAKVTPPVSEGSASDASSDDAPAVLPPALQSSVKVSGLCASWSDDPEKLTLKDLTFEVNKEQRYLAIVGKVGSGKSSLLQCLLGELKALRGQVDVSGRVSYASQVPWVFSGTIRSNITFGSEFKSERYNKVIEACALKQDIDMMVDGDLTLVGERGVTLSGGQKARVNLARAVYHDADIYLLDDPLSAVDTAVAKHIFERCIRGMLLHSQVILVTHQVQFAMRAQQLLALNEKGEVQLCHTQEELLERDIDQHQLLKILKDKGEEYVYDEVNEEEEEEEIFDHLDPLPAVLEDDEEEEEGEGNDFFPTTPPSSPLRMNSVNVEQSYRGILARADSIDARRAAGLEESITSLSRQRYASLRHDDNILGSYLNGDAIEGVETVTEETDASDALNEEKAHGTISVKTYFNFFRAGANYLVLFIILVLFFLAETGVVASDSWLSEWSNCDVINISDFEACDRDISSVCYLTQDQRMGIYGGITLTSIILNFIRTALFYLVCINASRVLHNRMFQALIRAPSRFFDINPSGRVLNRFSKDIGFLDDLLPHTFLEYLFLLLRFLAVLLTASYGNPYVLIPAAAIVVGFVSLRWYYLKTSRDIKRLEAIARSPVYSHFSITLQGLSTIRTLGKQPVTQYLFHNYQNEHTQGWYLYLVTSRWFGMRIDLISAVYLGIVAFISIPLAQSLDAGIIGLGLAYTIALAGILQYCVRQSAEVENIMISTERIMAYGQIEPEASLESLPDNAPPKDWPQRGTIEMDKVRFRYAPTLPYVINHLKFSIKDSEKVGIVGRTGAGKSSLISVLFRLAEPKGNISIDGFDTDMIGLHDLRGKMSIIPQDPVLFSGTMRYNLDPLDQYSDEKLWYALEQVELKSVVEQMGAGLSEEVSEGGSNFSVGQKQLICLARALLKENKILILDEATANVDPGTDEIIQQTIRSRFKDCTVLTIAHRLNTIMDSDRIMVMSRGRVVEFDSPYELLQKNTSQLYRMVEKTGPEASRQLHEMARRPVTV